MSLPITVDDAQACLDLLPPKSRSSHRRLFAALLKHGSERFPAGSNCLASGARLQQRTVIMGIERIRRALDEGDAPLTIVTRKRSNRAEHYLAARH